MGTQFNFLAKAKPAALFRLLEKLSDEDAAIVLTGVPHALSIQTLAFFPEEKQADCLPAMRAARSASNTQRDAVADKIRAILAAAKSARDEKTAAQTAAPATGEPSPLFTTQTKRPVPGFSTTTLPKPQPADPKPPAQPKHDTIPASPSAFDQKPLPMAVRNNPYAAQTPVSAPAPAYDAKPYAETTEPSSPLSAIGAKLKNFLANAASQAAPAKPEQPEKTKTAPPADNPKTPPSGKPTAWIPRTATGTPINAPARPGTPPAVAGDPLQSPLAKAGLLELIGRAQEKLLPKGSVSQTKPPHRAVPSRTTPERAPVRPRATRPKPREGVSSLDRVGFDATPKVIGPVAKHRSPPADAPASGARRMDGKAILAAILREAGPQIRERVQEDDPSLYRELRDRMFYFDDLIYTEDGALARVFTAAPVDTAALALKFAAPALRKRVLAVVSPGRAKALNDAPARAGLDAVEAAQKKVLAVALQLQAAGRILIDPRDPDLAGE